MRNAEEEAGLRLIGRIYQDLEDPEAPLYITLIDTAYKMNCMLLKTRLLRDARAIPFKEFWST